jgi:hypothetical protein
MKNFTIRDKEKDEYGHDIKRIVNVLGDRGYNCSNEQAKELWLKYSDSYSAGWIMLPNDDADVFQCIAHYIIEIEEDFT